MTRHRAVPTPAPRAASLEHEARRIGRLVARGSASSAPRIAGSEVQTEFPEQVADQRVLEPGRPLAGDLRKALEGRFHRDFSMVRVHTDGDAALAADAMAAHAFTRGNDIAFGPNQFAPATPSGLELLTHELAHTVQQADTGQPAVQMDPKGGKDEIGNAPPAEDFISMDTVGAEDDFVLFQRGSAELTTAGESKLIGLARGFSAPVTLHVHGYASAEGEPTFNFNLSAHRGVAVKKFLESKLPADSRVVIFAHGGTKDFGALGDNRRVGVSVMPSPGSFGYVPKIGLGEGLRVKPFGAGRSKPAGDTPWHWSGSISGDSPLAQPRIDLTVPPTLTPRHLMDISKLQGVVGGRGTGLREYGDLTETWDKLFLKYRGLGDDMAARLANSELAGTLEADAARSNPNANDRANEAWKAAHPNDTTIGPIMSPNLLELFSKKKKR